MQAETCLGLADFEFVSPSGRHNKAFAFPEAKRRLHNEVKPKRRASYALHISISSVEVCLHEAVDDDDDGLNLIRSTHGFRHDLWVLVRDLSCQAVEFFVPVNNIREFEKKF